MRTKKILAMPLTAMMLVTLLWTASCTSGPEPLADKAFARYEGQPGVLAFRLPPAMVNVAFSTSADRELKDFLKGMETIKVMIIGPQEEQKRDFDAVDADLRKKLTGDLGFEELVEVKKENNRVLILVHDEEEKTNEAAILVRGDDGYVALSLTGDIDLKELAGLAYRIRAEDFRKGD